MASIHGLPTLPKCLSGLMNASSTQWKEVVSRHEMQKKIQTDFNHASNSYYQNGHTKHAGSEEREIMVNFPPASSKRRSKRSKLDLDQAIIHLRKEMVSKKIKEIKLLPMRVNYYIIIIP